MVVKDKRGRRRYVAFEIVPHEAVSTEGIVQVLAAEFSRRGLRAPKLIQYGKGFGIVRCSNEELARTKEILNAVIERPEARSSTIKTSGTLRTLRDSIPILAAERPERRDRQGSSRGPPRRPTSR